MSEQRPVWSTEVRRFLSNYRWELWLLVGIPAIGVAQLIAENALELGQSDPYLRGLYLPTIASLSTRLLLLAGFYLLVRGLGREFLTLLWAYLIISSALELGFAAAHYLSVDDYFVYSTQSNGRLNVLVWPIAPVLNFLVLLWFARQASRISLLHAFFLVVFTNVTVWHVGLSTLYSGFYVLWPASFVPSATSYIVLLLKVWLLGNLDGWGPKHRRNAIFALVAAVIAGRYLSTAPTES